MQKILLYSPDVSLLEGVRAALVGHCNVPVSSALDGEGVRAQLESRHFHLGILCFDTADVDAELIVWQIRQAGGHFPIIIAAQNLDKAFLVRMEGKESVYIMDAPLKMDNLVALAKKTLVTKKLPKQHFRRYSTNQAAEVENMGSGASVLSCMYNLSTGGAYLEFEERAGLTPGDLIKLRVSLDAPQREHVMNAKVVWVTPNGSFSGRSGCGLKFISQKEAYQALMSKL